MASAAIGTGKWAANQSRLQHKFDGHQVAGDGELAHEIHFTDLHPPIVSSPFGSR